MSEEQIEYEYTPSCAVYDFASIKRGLDRLLREKNSSSANLLSFLYNPEDFYQDVIWEFYCQYKDTSEFLAFAPDETITLNDLEKSRIVTTFKSLCELHKGILFDKMTGKLKEKYEIVKNYPLKVKKNITASNIIILLFRMIDLGLVNKEDIS